MKEGFRRIREKLTGKETPGEKLHRKVSKLAKKGSFEQEGGYFYAGFAVSPSIEIAALFQPNDNTSILYKFETGDSPEESFEIASSYKISSDGSVICLGINDMKEVKALNARIQAGDEYVRNEMKDSIRAERDFKNITGVTDQLDDVQIKELLGLVKSKTLKRLIG